MQFRFPTLLTFLCFRLEISQARHSLIQLHVQNNQLEFIDNKMLQGFEKLLSVDLSHNDLIEVEANAFWKSHNLRKIILSDNNLRVIWKETFSDQVFFFFEPLFSHSKSVPSYIQSINYYCKMLFLSNVTSVIEIRGKNWNLKENKLTTGLTGAT